MTHVKKMRKHQSEYGYVIGESLLGEHNGVFSDDMLDEFEQFLKDENDRQTAEKEGYTMFRMNNDQLVLSNEKFCGTAKTDNEIWFDGYKAGKTHAKTPSLFEGEGWIMKALLSLAVVAAFMSLLLCIGLMIVFPLQAIGVL